jgi:hypothetical protein
MRDADYVTKYPVILRRKDGGHAVIAPDFDGHEVAALETQHALDLMRDYIEDVTWRLSFDNSAIPVPSEPGSLSKWLDGGDMVLLLPTVKRYNELPNLLYLYRPFDEKLNSMLENPYIWYSDPQHFNDPFEHPDIH